MFLRNMERSVFLNWGSPLIAKIVLVLYAMSLFISSQASPASHHPSTETTIYIIRHGEKPSDGSDGLTRKGKLRAQCVKRVLMSIPDYCAWLTISSQIFGAGSGYNIDYIISPVFRGEKFKRPYDTVLPLAKHLGIEIDAHWYV